MGSKLGADECLLISLLLVGGRMGSVVEDKWVMTDGNHTFENVIIVQESGIPIIQLWTFKW